LCGRELTMLAAYRPVRCAVGGVHLNFILDEQGADWHLSMADPV
jgi:hypothetical protein